MFYWFVYDYEYSVTSLSNYFQIYQKIHCKKKFHEHLNAILLCTELFRIHMLHDSKYIKHYCLLTNSIMCINFILQHIQHRSMFK